MIAVKLQGGLGNQMFQYAFGKAMSHKSSAELYFDNNSYHNNSIKILPKRKYELNLFSINVNELDLKSVKHFTDLNYLQSLMKSFKLYKKVVYKEPSLDFNNFIYNSSQDVYFDGYWQNEKYFDCISEELRRDFIFTKTLNRMSTEIALRLMSEQNSVSVHIRRGDYVTSKINNAVHGICSIDYYVKAFKLIHKNIKNPRFYFFSDDPAWVEQTLVGGLDNFQVVKHNIEDDSWQDMALMSKCKHHIIANSSFSWWGAWLNSLENKVVIAPKDWLAEESLNRQLRYLVPENWIRI